jgi:formylglycine-generating enzyme required for sulfatase activity
VTERIAHYSILREIGRGGQGVVYLAEDTRLGRRAALKVLDPGAGASGAALERFRREAEITSKLDHPGICPVYETGEADGIRWIAMRWVEGESLASRIASAKARADTWITSTARATDPPSGPRTWNEIAGVLSLIEDTARALHAAHERGVIHRDIKPGNVMVTKDGGPVILDFGLAQETDPGISTLTLTATGTLMGTPAYMSPEQIAGRHIKLDRRTDVYSLGVTLFESLTLERPFDAPTREQTYQAILGKSPPDVRKLNPAVTSEIRVVIETAIDKDRDRRYQTALDFAEDLHRARTLQPILAKPIGPVLRLKRFVQRSPALAAALGGLFLVLLAGLAVSLFLLARSEGERRLKQLALDDRQRAVEGRDAALADYERLGDLSRLQRLGAEADALWPASPANVPALREWVEHAKDLVKRLPSHRDALQRVAALAGTRDADRFRHDTTAKLVADLAAFEAKDGLLAAVEKRLAFAETVRDQTVGRRKADWDEAIRSIADQSASTAYRGLRMRPQLGLIPIGKDPRSGLWEFAHLQTAASAADAMPRRDDRGQLVVTDKTGLVFVLLPGATFRMGAVAPDEDQLPTEPNVDRDARPEEAPVTEVRLGPFFVSKYEMTQAQWLRMAGINPSHYHEGASFGDKVADLRNPVELVSARDCELWMERLGLEVPTEAQWEYAARGGTTAPWWTGLDEAGLVRAANLADETCRQNGGHPSWRYEPWDDGHTIHAPVGSFAPNPFGLHDVHGNVQEICRDRFVPYTAPARAGDGLRVDDGAPDKRMCRGGAFNGDSKDARSSARNSASATFRNDSLGLRPARSVSATDP